MNWVWLLLDVTLCIALSLSTALNLALRVVTRARLAPRFEAGGGRSFERFIKLRADFLQATAIVRTVLFVAMVVVVLSRAQLTGVSLADTRLQVAALLAIAVLLVFGVAVPTAWARYCGDGLIFTMMPALAVLRLLCMPLAVILNVFDPIVRRLAGVPLRETATYADQLEEEILHVVTEGELHGAVDEEEKEMIESVIELTDTRVDKVMTPRTQIVAIPVQSTLPEVLETIRTKGHSRVPVYEQTIDTILGVLYARDLLLYPTDAVFDLNKLIRKPLFIPESKLVRDLLREFQQQKVHIAIVLDEYGGTAGLVTIEDILEELVGEISDEYDFSSPQQFKRIDDYTVELDARMKVQDINAEFGLSLPEDGDYETIGGFVFSVMGRIPSVGEHCTFAGTTLQVIGAEPRRITRLRLNMRPPEESSDAPVVQRVAAT